MTDTSTDIRIRLATVADARVLAHHRAGMFRDMGRTDDESHTTLVAAAERFFHVAVPAGQYVAWLAYSVVRPEVVIAGAGVLVRQVPPFPITAPDGTFSVAEGRQALVQNVFTEKPWRRRGLAALLMEEVIAWSEREHIESLVLHASREGRPLYERLGFQQTNEMVYKDPRRFSR